MRPHAHPHVRDDSEPSRLPQRARDRQPRRANSWEESANDSNDGGNHDGLEEQLWRHGKRERNLAPGLEIHGRGAPPVEPEISDRPADNPTENREGQ